MEDAPKAPLVIGSFVGSGLLDGYVKLSGPTLLQSLSPLIASSLAARVLAAAFTTVVESTVCTSQILAHLHSHSCSFQSVGDLREMYKSSGANVMDFFAPAKRTEEHLAEWLEKYVRKPLSPLFSARHIITSTN